MAHLLRSGDPNTSIHQVAPAAFLDAYGFPSSLLSSSSKLEKSGEVGVLSRVLYMTPGIFCPSADTGCLLACLGHTSGRMGLPDSYRARDKRSAFYLEHREAFVERLKAEIHLLKADSMLRGLQPAVRLNGSSDIAWERRHAGILEQFPDVQFYDYTKILPRAISSLTSATWPANYHLTYSAGSRDDLARTVLRAGGTIAVVFHPKVPSTWLDAEVVDGEAHDARFRDRGGTVVALRAKGIAVVDVSGFTRRPCSNGCDCELAFEAGTRMAGRVRTRHTCPLCCDQVEASVADPYRNHRRAEQVAEEHRQHSSR